MPKGSVRSTDYYDLLEVSPRASKEVIHAAFKALMAKHHPDRSKGDNDIAANLSAAHSALTDAKERERYDRKRKDRAGTLVGNFRVLSQLAEGGFGTTYKGEHVRSGMPVCIKHCSEISPQAEEVLVNETRAIWDLKHYALPVMRDLHKLEDGSLALVMSFEEGPTLEQVVEKAGRLDPEHVAWITERCLNALMYLHMHGVVHGDIKPQNIIVKPKEHQVVLIDFGLAMIKPDKGSRAVGFTPFFAPPEQLQGRPLLPESDFFSLGATMLYALNGGDLGRVERREVPSGVPDPMCDFIRSLIYREVLSRPNWNKSNVFEDFLKARERSFGRKRSAMKAIPGF